jgi:hypothetical protein
MKILLKEITRTQTSFGGKLSFILCFLFPERLSFMPPVALIHEPSTFSIISLSTAWRMKLLYHQRVENFDGYLLTRSAVAWCSADEVQDGVTLERVRTRPVGP